MELVYIKEENDIQLLQQYRFGMTVYCMKMKDLKDYIRSKELIAEVIALLRKKTKDVQKNLFEKLVIVVDDHSLLSQISEKFPLLNLDFTLFAFVDLVDRIERESDEKWKGIKDEYTVCKTKLKKEIAWIQNLKQ